MICFLYIRLVILTHVWLIMDNDWTTKHGMYLHWSMVQVNGGFKWCIRRRNHGLGWRKALCHLKCCPHTQRSFSYHFYICILCCTKLFWSEFYDNIYIVVVGRWVKRVSLVNTVGQNRSSQCWLGCQQLLLVGPCYGTLSSHPPFILATDNKCGGEAFD